MSSWVPYVLPGARSTRLLSSAGLAYEILIAVPRRPAPPNGYPVIHVVDANALFGTMVEAVRMSARRADATGVPDAVIVGIGYPDVDLYDRARRTMDYTFGPPADPSSSDDPSLASGGGAAFLAFLQSEVRDLVRAEAHVDPERQALYGHSLGGLFVLSTLAREPEAFSTYLASSPSIWWDRDGLSRGLTSLASKPEEAAKVSAMICAGEYEQKLAPWQHRAEGREVIATRREGRGMVSNARHASDLLLAAGVRTVFLEFEGEDHASVPLLSINRGLRFALQPRLTLPPQVQ